MSSRLPEYASEIMTEEERVAASPALSSLMQSTGWALYTEILRRYRQQARETLESIGSMEALAEVRGMLLGLKLAEEAPQAALKLAEETMTRDEKLGRSRVYSSSGDPSF